MAPAQVWHGVIAFDLGGQLEEQPQLADLDRFFHDVDAVEVVDDDRLEDKVLAVGVRAAASRIAWKALSAADGERRPHRGLAQQHRHPIEAELVERLKDIQCSEQERA